MVRPEPDVSSILTSFSTEGIAIPIRIRTGTIVQTASSRALCSSFWSATAPFDFRKRTMAKIMAPKVRIARTVQIQNMIMCMPWISRESSETPSGMLIRLQSACAGKAASDAMLPATNDRFRNRLAMVNGAPGCGPWSAGARPAHRKGCQLGPQPDFFLSIQWDAKQARGAGEVNGGGCDIRFFHPRNDAEAGRRNA